jgi:hypothetical protein
MNILKKSGNYIAAFFKLGRTERIAKDARRDLSDMRTRLTDMRQHNETRLSELHGEVFTHINKLAKHIDAVAKSQAERQQHFEDTLRETTRATLRDVQVRHGELARSYAELSYRLDRVLLTLTGAEPVFGAPQPKMEGLEALKQSVLVHLETLTSQTRKDHLSSLLPEMESAVLRAGETAILDLYAGDGTWLALLKQAGLPAFAAHDISGTPPQVWANEARNTLANQKDNSLSVVSARHLLICLPFDELLWLTREAMRVLTPGGVLLIETADAEEMGIAFYDDPQHLRPLTMRSLQAVLETLGFEDITMQHLTPQSLICLGTKPLSGT